MRRAEAIESMILQKEKKERRRKKKQAIWKSLYNFFFVFNFGERSYKCNYLAKFLYHHKIADNISKHS